MFHIEEVIVYNRTDGGWGKRLNNFFVLISENPFSNRNHQKVHSFFKDNAEPVNKFEVTKQEDMCEFS